MKLIIVYSISTALLVGACSSGYYASAGRNDLYYSTDKNNTPAQVQNTSLSQSQQQSVKKSARADNNTGMTDYEKYRQQRDNGELNDSSANQSYYEDSVADQGNTQKPEVESSDYYGNNDESYGGSYYGPLFHRFNGYYSPYGWGYSFGYGLGYGWGGYYDPFYYDSWYPYYYNPYYYSYYPYGYGYYNHGYYHGWYGSDYYGTSRNGYYRGTRRSSSAIGQNARRTYPVRSANTTSSVRRSATNNTATTRAGSVSTQRTRSGMVYTRKGTTTNQTRRYTSSNPSERRPYTPSYGKPNSGRQNYNTERNYNNSQRSTTSESSRSYTPSNNSSNTRSSSSGSSSSSSYSRGSSGSSSSGSTRSSSGSGSSGSSGSSRSSSGGSSSGGGGHRR